MAKVSRQVRRTEDEEQDPEGRPCPAATTLYEAMRKTAGERGPLRNMRWRIQRSIRARTAENWDFVYDEATGDFREATEERSSIDAMSRRAGAASR